MYGKLIMSDEEMVAQAAVERSATNIYGPKVVGVTAEQAITQAKANKVAETPPVASYSEEQVVALLDETPALFSEIMAAELARQDGPREMPVTALLLAAEKTGQSAEVIEQLETLVASFAPPSAT